MRSLERPLIKHKALKVENLSVSFGPKIVLNHINFLVERYIPLGTLCIRDLLTLFLLLPDIRSYL